MKVIGITGGIGSGKSTISKMIRDYGYPVFDCDEQAKKLYIYDIYTINEIKEKFGDNIYVDGVLDRQKLANIVFNDKGSLDTLNSIIHPKTREYMYLSILDNMDKDLFFVESAIMFESGLNEYMDKVISVTAPEKTRIDRVIKRDNTTKEQILNRMSNQMSEKDRLTKCDYIIDTNQTLHKVDNLVFDLLGKIKLLKDEN